MKEADTVLVRYGEISLKSQDIRSRMTNRLCSNINSVLKDRDIEGIVKNKWSRIFVDDIKKPGKVVDAVADVPGVVSASPCRVTDPDMESIRKSLRKLAEGMDFSSFRVTARRAGEKEAHPFTSQDIEREGGSAVMSSEEGLEVDLEDFDQEFFVECRKDRAFIFSEKVEGPGGLPVGSEGKVVALISGGHDSPVAAYSMMKRGCEIVPVYISMGEYSGIDHEIRAMETLKALKKFHPEGDWDMRIVEAGEYVGRMMDELRNTRMVSFRRFMFRVAEIIAQDEGCRGIVTGESLGQKSSQTLGNLKLTSKAVNMPVHRPLLTRDKSDIVETARSIGTFKGSKIRAGCTEIAPSRPETSGDEWKVFREEPDELFEWAEKAAERVRKEEV